MGNAAAHLARANDADLADWGHVVISLGGWIGAEPAALNYVVHGHSSSDPATR